MSKISSLFLASALGAALAIGGYKLIEKDNKTQPKVENNRTASVHFASLGSSPEMTTDFTEAAEKTVNSVVHVFTETELAPMVNPWAQIFGYQNVQPHIQRGSGSGVIISKNGYIVTNNHVVDGAQRIKVNLNNNKTYDAEVIGTDPSTDLALLKIDADELPAITFGNSDNLKVGEWVLAVGNPFNLTSTVTAGIVSAKGRDIDILKPDYSTGMSAIESFIQTDAAVNPGNSGGALVNTRGELVGINSAIASTTGAYAGYSFAIPITIVQKVTKDLMDYGTVQRAFIGVRIANVDENIAAQIGLDDIHGVYVSEAVENGAAKLAGMLDGDVITQVDSKHVNTVPELQDALGRHSPGETVNILVWRNNEIISLDITLTNKEGTTEIENKAQMSSNAYDELGIEASTVSPDIKNQLGIHGGVIIDQLNHGKFAQAGIEKNFVITSINGTKIYDLSDFERVIGNASGGVLIEGIYPNGVKAYYGLGL